MIPILEHYIACTNDSDTLSVIGAAERRRQALFALGKKEVPIWFSPKPGSAGLETGIDARPNPGKALSFTMEQIALTGKNQIWATVLYMIAKEFGVTTILELGTCAGISALYLSAAPQVKQLLTVEGSSALAEIARESLKDRKNTSVINCMFDQAFDEVLPSINWKLDLAYIDGHHEKTATIHYFNRVLPFMNVDSDSSVVIFDDISWSYDMRDAWKQLSMRSEFAHSIDMGEIGVCILRKQGSPETRPQVWDAQPLVGRHPIGDPDGWKD